MTRWAWRVAMGLWMLWVSAGCTPQGQEAVEEKEAKPCPNGQERNLDTHGQCCWPGQAWSLGKQQCVGQPQCPELMQPQGNSCERPCKGGKSMSIDTKGQCCWPGQVWSELAEQCVGTPDACPPGFEARSKGCELRRAGRGQVEQRGRGVRPPSEARDRKPRRGEDSGERGNSYPVFDDGEATPKRLSKAQIQQVVRQNFSKVRACSKRADVKGKLKVSFTIQLDGNTSALSVKSPEFEGSKVAACILDVVAKMYFPASEEESQVTYPFQIN